MLESLGIRRENLHELNDINEIKNLVDKILSKPIFKTIEPFMVTASPVKGKTN